MQPVGIRHLLPVTYSSHGVSLGIYEAVCACSANCWHNPADEPHHENRGEGSDRRKTRNSKWSYTYISEIVKQSVNTMLSLIALRNAVTKTKYSKMKLVLLR